MNKACLQGGNLSLFLMHATRSEHDQQNTPFSLGHYSILGYLSSLETLNIQLLPQDSLDGKTLGGWFYMMIIKCVLLIIDEVLDKCICSNKLPILLIGAFPEVMKVEL